MTQNQSGRAQIHLGVHDLERILRIPEGTHITRMQVDLDPHGIRFVVEGPGLPVTPVDYEAPFLTRVEERVEMPVVVSETVRWA